MNFTELVSNYLAKKLALKVPNTKYETIEDQIEVYTYAIMGSIGELITGILLMLISLCFGVFIPTILIAFTFCTFRPKAGGYHFKTHLRCTIATLTTIIGTALIAQHTLQFWSLMNTWYLFIFCIMMSLYIIFRYVPRDTKNRLITEKSERSKFKRWSLYYIVVWGIIMTIFNFLNLKIIVISSCFGLLLELYSLSALGNKIYSLLDK